MTAWHKPRAGLSVAELRAAAELEPGPLRLAGGRVRRPAALEGHSEVASIRAAGSTAVGRVWAGGPTAHCGPPPNAGGRARRNGLDLRQYALAAACGRPSRHIFIGHGLRARCRPCCADMVAARTLAAPAPPLAPLALAGGVCVGAGTYMLPAPPLSLAGLFVFVVCLREAASPLALLAPWRAGGAGLTPPVGWGLFSPPSAPSHRLFRFVFLRPSSQHFFFPVCSLASPVRTGAGGRNDAVLVLPSFSGAGGLCVLAGRR